MFVIILSILLAVITAGILGIKFKKDSYGELEVDSWKPNLKMFIGLVWGVLILFKCFSIIPANSVGILYDPFDGGVQENTLGEGFKKKSPLEKVYVVSTKVQEMNFTELSVQSQDSQWLNTQLQVQARIDKTKAFDYFKKYGNKDLEDISSIISNTIKKELESVTIKYNITDILGEKRNDIVNETLVLVQNELMKDGILIERIVLIDTDAGTSIEEAIAAEAVAKKNVDTAAYKRQQAELEGEAKVIEAQKEKEANELISKTLTKEILIEEWIDAWKAGGSQVPKASGDNFMLNIEDLLK